MQSTIPAWRDDRLIPIDKLDVHRLGLRHPAVSVFVFAGDALLLQRRALGKYHTPGLWANTCCTHPHWGESAEACAARRLAEELGLRDLALEPRGQVEYRADVGGGMVEHEVVDLFVARCNEPPEATPDPDEVMDLRWIGVDALATELRERPEAFTPWLRIYLRDHAGRLGFAV